MTYDPESARYAPRRAFVVCRRCGILIGIAGAGMGEFTCGKCASAKASGPAKDTQGPTGEVAPLATRCADTGGEFSGSNPNVDTQVAGLAGGELRFRHEENTTPAINGCQLSIDSEEKVSDN